MTLPTDGIQARNEIVSTSADLIRAIAEIGNEKTRMAREEKILGAELASLGPVNWRKSFLFRPNLSSGGREKSPIQEGVV